VKDANGGQVDELLSLGWVPPIFGNMKNQPMAAQWSIFRMELVKKTKFTEYQMRFSDWMSHCGMRNSSEREWKEILRRHTRAHAAFVGVEN
jgi:hypothetical protein